jgi:hypothetical protein
MTAILLAIPLLLAQTPPDAAAASSPSGDAGTPGEAAVTDGGAAPEADAGTEVPVDGGTPAPPSPPGPPAPVVEKPSTTATISAGLIWLQGNSSSLTFSASAAASHTFSGGWILSGKADAAYGDAEAAGTTTSQVSAYSAGGLVRGDKVIVPDTSVYVQGGASTDHVASLELRYFGEAGGAIFWFDRKEGDFQKLLLRTDIGFRFQEDDNWQYYPTATIPGTGPQGDLTFIGPRFGVAFRYAFNKGMIFTEDASLLENLDGDSRTLASSATKFSSQLMKHLALAVSFLVTYDSNLTNLGKVDTDTALTVGLEGSL